MHEILLPKEMASADRLAAEDRGTYRLMQNAGAAVTAEILAGFPDASGYDILCGPGNNGGDGYVIARLLGEKRLDVRLWSEAPPRSGTDGARAAEECPIPAGPLEDFQPEGGRLLVDALFGAGLSKPVKGTAAAALERAKAARARSVAVDLPSGVSGESGAVLGAALPADMTVTFFRKKAGHLLYPGRALCGRTIVADIGIPPRVLETIGPNCFENGPALWETSLPRPQYDTHKYQRGHAAIFCGPPTVTGAARLAARGAARIGAGAVTLLSPASALAVNAMHLTAIMLRRTEDEAEFLAFMEQRRPSALVLGPGFGIGERACRLAELALHPLSAGVADTNLVLDADCITSFAGDPDRLFTAAVASAATLVLTPHEGEFARLFPDLAGDGVLSKLEKARHAAARAQAVVVLKGADTVIAGPDGRAAINSNATPYLATAGSGDVLAGMIAGLLAQDMPGFEAACAAVWLHAETGRAVGPGLIAEDLPEALPCVLREFLGDHRPARQG